MLRYQMVIYVSTTRFVLLFYQQLPIPHTRWTRTHARHTYYTVEGRCSVESVYGSVSSRRIPLSLGLLAACCWVVGTISRQKSLAANF
jgi:hypothetical protein